MGDRPVKSDFWQKLDFCALHNSYRCIDIWYCTATPYFLQLLVGPRQGFAKVLHE